MTVNKDWANSCYDREWRILNVVTELSLLALKSGVTLCQEALLTQAAGQGHGCG